MLQGVSLSLQYSLQKLKCSINLQNYLPTQLLPPEGLRKAGRSSGKAAAFPLCKQCICPVRVTCANLAVKLLHRYQVQGFQGMACWSNEVQASVDPGVMVVVQDPSYLQFFLQVGFKLSINELNDGLIALVKEKKQLYISFYISQS